MKYLLILVGSFLSFELAAQEKRRILDRVTEMPVSYVTIKVLNSVRGVIGSAVGEFTIKVERGDSILFSCAGYTPIIILGNRIESIVYMEPRLIELKTVFIESKILSGTLTIGNEKKIAKGDITWGPSPSGSYDEFAQKIILPDSPVNFKITKVFIPIKKLNCIGPILLRVYYADSSKNQPGVEILNKLIDAANMPIKKNILSIDVNTDNLFFYGADSFFVSITWPPEAFYNKCLTGILLSKHSVSQTYSRTLTINSFKWFPFVGRFKDKNDNHFEPRTYFAIEAGIYR